MFTKVWNNKLVKFIIRYVLPLIIIVFILKNINLPSIKSVIQQVDSRFLLLGGIGTIIQFASYAYRWDLILKITKIKYSFWKSFQIYLANFFIGSFVPGTFGGFLKVMHVVRDGWPADKAIISVIFEKIYEIFFTALFALVLLLIVPNLYNLPISNIYISVIVIVSVTAGIYLGRKTIFGFIKNLVLKRVSNSGVNIQTNALLESIRDILQIENTTLLLLISFMVRLGEAIAFFLFAKSIGSHVTFLQALFFSAIIAIITSLPISFSGIGTRDLALIMLFSTIGESKELAISISILILLSIIFMRVIGMIFWLKDPISMKRPDANPVQ